MIWLNGALVAPSAARIDPADRGLLLGDGVFETVRATGGQPAHLARHLARLRHGAAVLAIPFPWTNSVLTAALQSVLGAAPHPDAALRITLTRGPAARGLLAPPGTPPTLLITAAPLPAPATPACAIIASVTRRNEHSPLSRIKSLSYLDSILARQEARANRADDAILLNTQGRIAEASAANIFIATGGCVLTPPIAEGALPGIARALLLEADLAREHALTIADMRGAQSAFTTNSLGVRALSHVDGIALKAPHAAMMQKILAALV